MKEEKLRDFLEQGKQADRKALNEALGTLKRVAAKRSTMPILTCVRVGSDADGGLQLAATDRELGVLWTFGDECPGPATPFCVDAAKLSELVRKGKGCGVVFEPEEGTVKVTIGAASATLVTSSVEEFPTMLEVKRVRAEPMKVEVVAKLCAETEYAASHDETRYNLSGVYVEVVGAGRELCWTATDGHRMALSYCEDVAGFPFPKSGVGVIVPRRFIEELGRLAGAKRPVGAEVTLRAHYHAVEAGTASPGGLLSATIGPVTLTTRLTEGEYPNYRQVIPPRGALYAEVDRAPLVEALESVATMAATRFGVVQVTVAEGELRLKVQNPDLGDASCSVPAGTPDGSTIEFVVSVGYLVQAVKAADGDRVRLGFTYPLSPIRVDVDGSRNFAIVMPVRP